MYQPGDTITATNKIYYGTQYPSRVIFYNKQTTGVDRTKEYGNEFPNLMLNQNYPNPFNPMTKIRFRINQFYQTKQLTTLKIFDMLGKEVVTLFNEWLYPGEYEIDFDINCISGRLPSGTYFYKIGTGNSSQIKRMLLLK